MHSPTGYTDLMAELRAVFMQVTHSEVAHVPDRVI